MLKGRKFLSIFILGITSFLLLLSVSIPISFKTKASVPFSLGKTMEQFTNEQQLEKWFLPFENSSPKLLSAKPGNLVLNISGDGIDRDYRFLVTRDKRSNFGCLVTMSIENTLWKRMIDPDPIDGVVMNSMKNLERITNNTTLFYGFPIYKTTIKDSSYLYITGVVDADKKEEGTRKLFDSLFQYARITKISNSGKRIFSSQSGPDGKLRVYAGIAIHSSGTINPATGITIKKMVPGKTLLVADYKGKYNEISAAYKALDQYKRDNQLAGMEIPFEEFLTPGNSYDANDSVQVKVCAPIY